MSALLITYDLNKPGQNYEELYERIKRLGTWWHYLGSTWIVICPLTPSQAFDRIRESLDASLIASSSSTLPVIAIPDG